MSTFRKQPDTEDVSLQAKVFAKFCNDETSRVLQSLFSNTPTHLPTVRFWNKAFGLSTYLIINVKRPLYIIDKGCDGVFFETKTHTYTESWSTELSAD